MADSSMAEENPTSVFIQSIQRDLNCLSDPDRSTRRRALERLHKLFTQDTGGVRQPSPEVLQAAWDDVILPMVLKLFYDSVEKCRELAVFLMICIANRILEVERTTVLTVAAIAERIGHLPVLEESEEIRLSYITLLSNALIARCSINTLQLILEPLCQVLCLSLADPFHEIKKATSQVILLIVKRDETIPKEISESLIKALLANISHTHSKVRIAILQAIDAIMRCDLPAGLVAESLVPSVQSLAFDRTVRVRELFFESVARWLGYEKDIKVVGEVQPCIKKGRDPSVHVPQLLPLLLLGIFDESVDVGSASLFLVENVGKVYELFACNRQPARQHRFDMVEVIGAQDIIQENSVFPGIEYEAKPGMEFTESTIQPSRAILPVPFKDRPGKGSRTMVQDFFGRLVHPALKGLQEWTIATRRGAARLLHTLLILAEEKANNHLDLLIPSICSAVGDDDISVAQHIVGAVHILGYRVSPGNWLPLVLDHVSSSGATSSQVANGLVVLSGLLYGTPAQVMDKNSIVQISQQLAQANLGFSEHTAVRRQLLAVLTNLIRVGGSLCESSSADILIILLQVQSSEADVQVKQAARDLEDTLAKVIGLASARELFERHLQTLVVVVTAGHEGWLVNSPGRFLFHIFMQNAGNVVGPYLQSLLQIFINCLHSDRDPALHISFLQLLDELFEIPELSEWWTPIAPLVVGSILVPCGVWQVGKVGAAIRHATMVALGTILRRDLCSQVRLSTLLHSEQMLAVIVSCLEEDYYVDTRHVTCHVLENVLRIAGSVMDEDQMDKVRNALQKRLDDSSDRVRLGILPAISAFFYTMPESYSDACVKSFLSTVLLHMDDRNREIQEAVYRTAEICTVRRPAVVEEVVKSIHDHHQMREYCDNLLAEAAYRRTTEQN